MHTKLDKIIFAIGVIFLTIIIGFRIEAFIEAQNNNTYSALIGWLVILLNYIAYKTKDNPNKK